jgi:asparagine synthase (glutamine-hydrolysing)
MMVFHLNMKNILKKENILPNEVLWRKKEAFSDGVSGLKKSWSDIIKEYVELLPNDLLSNIDKQYEHNHPTTKEQQYYRYLFETMYPKCSSIISYFWMPKFTEATDSSARTLSIYNSH